MHCLLVLSLLIWILACGEEDNGTGPTFANVNGSWTLSITNMTGEGTVCSTSSPVEITLQQNTTKLNPQTQRERRTSES
jgi:hypothetical protein